MLESIVINLISNVISFFCGRFYDNYRRIWLIIKSVLKYDKDIRFSIAYLYKIKIDEDEYNVVEIKNKEVRMKEANCRDLLCTHMPSIKKVGETIVCLPHRLILEIISSDDKKNDDEIDKVVG